MTKTEPYWGGETTDSNKVRPLQAETFKDLVESYFHLPYSLQVGREEFHLLSESEQRRAKVCPYVTPCSFLKPIRRSENARRLKLAALDLDPPEGDGPDYVRDFHDSPETVADALYPLSFVLHATASSTPERPRLRIIVPIDDGDPADYPRYVRYLAVRLGIPSAFKGSTESSVAVQPMYRPVVFRGESTSPVLCSCTTGQSLSLADIPREAEEDDDGLGDDPRTYARDHEDFDLTSLPVPDLTVEDILEALNSLDPDMTYHEWVQVGMALQHQFRREEDARDAYLAFDEWSSGGEKYKGEKETFAKWTSFRMGRTCPVTIRSLVHYAAAAGWNSKKVGKTLGDAFITWLEACGDEATLLEEGPRRIAAIPFKNDLVEDSMVTDLKNRIKDVSKKTIDKATIKKEVSNRRFRDKEEARGDSAPPWLNSWCFVSTENVFQNAVTGVRMIPAAFNATFGSELMPTDKDSELAKSGRPAVLPADLALNVVKIPKVSGVAYDPTQGGSEPYFHHGGLRYLNEFRPSTYPKLDPEHAEMAKELMRSLYHVLVGEEHVDMLEDFIAWCIQNPGGKTRWAPLIQSAQGAGKSLMAALMSAAMGEENVMIVNPGVIASDFNSYIYGCMFCIVEEIVSPGKNRAEFANKFKDVLTNDKVTCNQKHKDPRVIKNVANFIFFTNRADALHLEESDRRYWVIRSPIQFKQQAEKLADDGFFKPLDRLRRKFPGAIRSYLLEHKIRKGFPVNGPAPSTSFRDDLIEASKNPLQVVIEDLIESDDTLVGDDVIVLEHLNRITALESRNNHRPAHYLSLLGYVPYANGRRFRFGRGERSAVWVHQLNYDPSFGAADEIIRERKEKIEKEL